MLQFYNFNSGEMFACLWLWTRFGASDEKENSVHDRSTIQYGCYENIVSWTVDEGDMTEETHCATASIGSRSSRIQVEGYDPTDQSSTG